MFNDATLQQQSSSPCYIHSVWHSYPGPAGKMRWKVPLCPYGAVVSMPWGALGHQPTAQPVLASALHSLKSSLLIRESSCRMAPSSFAVMCGGREVMWVVWLVLRSSFSWLVWQDFDHKQWCCLPKYKSRKSIWLLIFLWDSFWLSWRSVRVGGYSPTWTLAL